MKSKLGPPEHWLIALLFLLVLAIVTLGAACSDYNQRIKCLETQFQQLPRK